jgi:putative transposase
MPAKDAPVKRGIELVIGTSRRGRKKVIKKLQKEHPEWSASRIRRVYERSGFSLFRRLRKRLQHRPLNPLIAPLSRNQEWAMDFMSDALVCGRKIRTFNVIDEFNRECLGIQADFSLPARRITAILDRAIERYGKPVSIRTDNGSEFTSKWFQLWMLENKIQWSPIQKGQPQQNAFIERFNRTYREEVLDANVFKSTEHAQQLTNQFILDYNHGWLHESLNFQTPVAYAA